MANRIVGFVWVIAVLLAGCGASGYTRVDAGGQYAYTHPAWSPDGTKLAYTRYAVYDSSKGFKPDTGEIFVSDLAAKSAVQLTQNAQADTHPAWSPDGARLAYGQAGDPDQLHVVNADGTADRIIYACPAACGAPDWSPAAEQIVFYLASDPAAANEAPSEIYLINADGTGLKQLTHGSGHTFAPHWSPDGKQIAFQRAGEQPIHVFNLATQVETALDPGSARGPIDPGWAHDQSGVIFSAYGERGARRLFIYRFADRTVTQLLTTDGSFPPDMVEPAWSRDGKQIAFSVFYQKLYVADVAATRVK